jgi:hypothetical protein
MNHKAPNQKSLLQGWLAGGHADRGGVACWLVAAFAVRQTRRAVCCGATKTQGETKRQGACVEIKGVPRDSDFAARDIVMRVPLIDDSADIREFENATRRSHVCSATS